MGERDDMRGQFPDYVTTQELAAWFGYTPEWVQRLVGEGVLTPSGAREHGKGHVFHPYDAAAEMIAYQRNALRARKPKDETVEEAATRKLIADADWKEHQAEKMRLEVAKMKGLLHEADIVAGYIGQLVSLGRAQIESVPKRAARLVLEAAGIVPTKSQEVAAIRVLEVELDMVQQTLSEYEYKPEEMQSGVSIIDGTETDDEDE